MRVLAIDTSSEACSVAVVEGGELLAEADRSAAGRHGDVLFDRIAHALEQAGISKRSIELIAVGVGPGSFTGTRVGLAAAKGLALALDVPLVGAVSLRAMARAAPVEIVDVAILVDAHKGEVYAALYRREGEKLIELVAPFHASPLEAIARLGKGPIAAIGSGVRRYRAELGDAIAPLDAELDVPHGFWIAQEAMERYAITNADERSTLEPHYVRGSDALIPPAR